jgi:hypothetical protein
VMMFTCKVCETRTARRVGKAAFHHGTVLVRCPGCLGLHVIADHKGFFSDEPVDAEAILAARGEAVKRGSAVSGDLHVFELTADDARVLASRGKAVRLKAFKIAAAGAVPGTGEEGEELSAVTFDGVLTATRGEGKHGRG